MVKDKVVKDNRTNNHLRRPRACQVRELGIHQSKPEVEANLPECFLFSDLKALLNLQPLAFLLVALAHCPEEVTARPYHPQNLRDGRRIDLTRREPIAGKEGRESARAKEKRGATGNTWT